MLFSEVLPQRSNSAVSDLIVPWVVFYSISTVTATVAFLIKIHLFIRAVRFRRDRIESDPIAQDSKSLHAKLDKHKMNSERTTRRIHQIYAVIGVSVCENLPLGVLTMVFSVRMAQLDLWGIISLATSFWSLGIGMGSIPLLKDLLPYRKKQLGKIEQLKALIAPNEAGLEML